MLLLAILLFIIGDAASTELPKSPEDRVGPLNLTPHEAGIVAFAAVLALGVVGLMCVVLVAAVCGYRVQATALYRKLRDVEAEGSRRTETSEQADSNLDLPPPPPAEDENDNVAKDGTMLPVPEPTSLPLSVTTKAELDSSQEVENALGDMDAAVDGATCSTASGNEVDCDSEKLGDATTDETTETEPEGATGEETTEIAEAASDGAAAVEADSATGEETTEAGPEGTPVEEDAAVAGATYSTASGNEVDCDSEKLGDTTTDGTTETVPEEAIGEETTEIAEAASDEAAAVEATDNATGEETTEAGPEGTTEAGPEGTPVEEDEETTL